MPGADLIRPLAKELRGNGIAVYFAGVHAPVLEYGRQIGLMDYIGEDRMFSSLDATVRELDIRRAR